MHASAEFREQLDDLFEKRLSDILRNVSILQKWSADREMFADVLYQISLGWRDSPDIRYHWTEVWQCLMGVCLDDALCSFSFVR